MAKTKEEKRKAWRDYYKKNKVKYLAWSRGYRSGMKVTPEEFNAKWEKEHEVKEGKKS